jgi:hypothetical protein
MPVAAAAHQTIFLTDQCTLIAIEDCYESQKYLHFCDRGDAPRTLSERDLIMVRLMLQQELFNATVKPKSLYIIRLYIMMVIQNARV